jgi:phenylalanyl-tRNA synthetase beta chain
MNISYRWLRAIAPTITDAPHELAERLALLGAPVDEIVELSEGLRGVVIARVEEVRRHPNADRLRLCLVDAGAGHPLQVVCGASNVEAGGFYPFAPVGATLPGGLTIGRAKLRGELSEGMLCSARELGLGRDHLGIMTLRGEWAPGSSFIESLGLDDVRLLVDVTPNRPDLLSHLGVAREAAPGGTEDLRLPELAGADGRVVEIASAGESGRTAGVRVTIDDSAGCPRYLGAVLRGVRVGPSPEWLATRLRSVGLRPINNVVDATNYVLIELGQPLHAFDLERLGSDVRVRLAGAGETIRTLDGTDRPLEAGMLVIADASRPVAVAGVMGGEETEVTESTRDIFLECALFEPKTVRRAARSLGLSTDSSYRFERGVDPDLQPVALRRAIALIRAVAGGTLDGHAIDLLPRKVERTVVALRLERVERVLGVGLTEEALLDSLGQIGFVVEPTGGALRVRVPGYRPDVTREIDVIEEVARRIGYEAFPEELLPLRPTRVPEDPLLRVGRAVQDVFTARGFLEARTVSFAPEQEGRVPLLNPLSAEESHLRDALGPGLLRRLEHNWSRGTRDVRLFEIGTVFGPGRGEELVREEVRVAAVFTGSRRPAHWSEDAPAYDLWDLKALLSDLGPALGPGAEVLPGEPAFSAALLVGDLGFELRVGEKVVGGGGLVREGAVDAPAWAGDVWLVEARIPRGGVLRASPRYRPVPEQPAVERDLALLTPVGVPSAEVDATIHAAAGDLLEAVRPFDLYEGKGLPEGSRSVAWRLRFRAANRTLTDAEVDAAVERVLTRLEEGLGVRRR